MTPCRAYLAALAFVAALAACGGSDGTGPGGRVPQLGRYAYTADLWSGGLGPRHVAGTLAITYADPDSIAGTWAVPGYEPGGRLGGWNADAYVLYAREVGSGSFTTHRIGPPTGGGDALACQARYLPGDGQSYPSPCTLRYVGP